jgi:AcrR family transcriptional regulator
MSLLQEIESAEPSDIQDHSAVERLILKHAMRSFGRRGYAATTLRAVASEASVSAPLVSYYFKSKENLFLEVAEIVMRSLEAEVARALETPRPFYESVVAIVQAHVDLVERSPAAVEFMFSMLYGPQEGQPSPDLETMYAGTRQRIVAVFERGIASGELEPRAGMSVSFLVEQLGNLTHSHASCRFKAARLIELYPERRGQIECGIGAMSLETALEHFFFGAGDVPALQKRSF